MRQEKRHKLQLFNDIICAVEDNMVNSEYARPTHVQHYSRLSYNKMSNYFGELEGMGMICRHSGGLISTTTKGREFTKQYRRLINLVESVGL